MFAEALSALPADLHGAVVTAGFGDPAVMFHALEDPTALDFVEFVVQLPVGSTIPVTGVVLSAPNLEAALKHATLLAPHFTSVAAASAVPQQLLPHFTRTALQQSSLPVVLIHFGDCGPLTPWTGGHAGGEPARAGGSLPRE